MDADESRALVAAITAALPADAVHTPGTRERPAHDTWHWPAGDFRWWVEFPNTSRLLRPESLAPGLPLTVNVPNMRAEFPATMAGVEALRATLAALGAVGGYWGHVLAGPEPCGCPHPDKPGVACALPWRHHVHWDGVTDGLSEVWVTADSEAEARGYRKAIEALRDRARFTAWVGGQPPEDFCYEGTLTYASYLEAMAGALEDC